MASYQDLDYTVLNFLCKKSNEEQYQVSFWFSFCPLINTLFGEILHRKCQNECRNEKLAYLYGVLTIFRKLLRKSLSLNCDFPPIDIKSALFCQVRGLFNPKKKVGYQFRIGKFTQKGLTTWFSKSCSLLHCYAEISPSLCMHPMFHNNNSIS